MHQIPSYSGYNKYLHLLDDYVKLHIACLGNITYEALVAPMVLTVCEPSGI